jgi:hypothetical protein
MGSYRKKPVVITAEEHKGPDAIIIKTLEGEHRAEPGDMIITGVKGERYPCKPDIFVQTYEAVEGAPMPTVESPVTELPPWIVFDRKDGTADVLPAGRAGHILFKVPLAVANAVVGAVNLVKGRY